MKNFSRIIASDNGSTLVASLLASALVVMAAGSAYKTFNATAQSFRAARIKSLMSGVEAQARILSQQPEAYVNCQSNSSSECQLNIGFFSNLALQRIPGADCAGGVGSCGISLTGLSYLPASKQFRATVSYEGREITLKPISLVETIPVEVLQMDNFHCGERDRAKPIFAGFDNTTGAPICRGFPPCSGGYFVATMGVSGHTLECKPLPSAASCGAEQMLSSLSWSGGSSVSISCTGTEQPPFHGGLGGSSAGPMASVDRTPPILTAPAPSPAPPPNPGPATPPACQASQTGLVRAPSGAVFNMFSDGTFCGFYSPEHMWRVVRLKPEAAVAVASIEGCVHQGNCTDVPCNSGIPGGAVRTDDGATYENYGEYFCGYISPQHLWNNRAITPDQATGVGGSMPSCLNNRGPCDDYGYRPGMPHSG